MSSSSAESKMKLAKIVLSASRFYYCDNHLTMTIDEFNGLVNNEIHEAAEIYLSNKLSPNIHRLKTSKPEKEKNINIVMERNEEDQNLFSFPWPCSDYKVATRFASLMMYGKFTDFKSLDVRGQLVAQIDCNSIINFVVNEAIKFVNHHRSDLQEGEGKQGAIAIEKNVKFIGESCEEKNKME
uniref:AAA-type ATPase N-terminal domain-containing protein n=1 Tax=Solanum lycopersicum TaxID=4081 RepID=A0A3Q7FIN7_SOLLC